MLATETMKKVLEANTHHAVFFESAFERKEIAPVIAPTLIRRVQIATLESLPDEDFPRFERLFPLATLEKSVEPILKRFKPIYAGQFSHPTDEARTQRNVFWGEYPIGDISVPGNLIFNSIFNADTLPSHYSSIGLNLPSINTAFSVFEKREIEWDSQEKEPKFGHYFGMRLSGCDLLPIGARDPQPEIKISHSFEANSSADSETIHIVTHLSNNAPSLMVPTIWLPASEHRDMHALINFKRIGESVPNYPVLANWTLEFNLANAGCVVGRRPDVNYFDLTFPVGRFVGDVSKHGLLAELVRSDKTDAPFVQGSEKVDDSQEMAYFA